MNRGKILSSRGGSHTTRFLYDDDVLWEEYVRLSKKVKQERNFQLLE